MRLKMRTFVGIDVGASCRPLLSREVAPDSPVDHKARGKEMGEGAGSLGQGNGGEAAPGTRAQKDALIHSFLRVPLGRRRQKEVPAPTDVGGKELATPS